MKAHIQKIKSEIAAACETCGRNPDEITLVGVTKTQSAESIQQAINAGIDVLGENRIQEAELKIPQIHGKAQWHMIGHLQSNKAKKAVELFDWIQSVDSLRLADKLSNECVKQNKTLNILFQVNTSGEDTKSGFTPTSFLASMHDLFAFEHLKVRGLMTIGAHTTEESAIRYSFRALKDLFERLQSSCPSSQHIDTLSMGMTDDFALAIEEGSTMIRVGRALFGERN